jgi:flagellar biosynthetic protein FliR
MDSILSQATLYGCVLIRVLAILTVFPLWSGRLPMSWKVAAAVWVSVLFSFVVRPAAVPDRWTLPLVLVGGVREFLTGALLGLFVRLILAGVMLAGQLLGFQMGLGIANVIDPATSESVSVIAEVLNLLALFLFLELDGHLMAVKVVAKSFEWIPPFSARLDPALFLEVVRDGGGQMFQVGLALAWPFSLALLLVYLGMGLLARVAPQVNLLVVGFPITIGVGLFVLFLGVSPLTVRMEGVFSETFHSLEKLLASIGR